MQGRNGSLTLMMGVVLSCVTVGGAARADDAGGAFIGAGAGRAQIDNDNASFQAQLQTQVQGVGTLDYTRASLRKRTDAWWVDTGYMFTPYFGAEASYFHFGTLSNQVAGTFTPTGGTAESVALQTALGSEGPALGVVFRLPLAEGVDVSFRAADYYGRSTLTNALVLAKSTVQTTSADNHSLLLGVGAAYSFAGHWSIRADYFRVSRAGNASTVVKYDVDMATLGLGCAF
jgi:hypothetical protein